MLLKKIFSLALVASAVSLSSASAASASSATANKMTTATKKSAQTSMNASMSSVYIGLSHSFSLLATVANPNTAMLDNLSFQTGHSAHIGIEKITASKVYLAAEVKGGVMISPLANNTTGGLNGSVLHSLTGLNSGVPQLYGVLNPNLKIGGSLANDKAQIYAIAGVKMLLGAPGTSGGTTEVLPMANVGLGVAYRPSQRVSVFLELSSAISSLSASSAYLINGKALANDRVIFDLNAAAGFSIHL